MIKRYPLRSWHWFGLQLASKGFKTWDSLINNEEFQDFIKRREITDYEIEFIKQGYHGENFQALQTGVIFPFGAHKGKLFKDVPDKYLEWTLKQSWLEKWAGLELQIKEYLA